MERRDFLKGLVGLGAGAVISFNEAKKDEKTLPPLEKFSPNESLSADKLNALVDRVNDSGSTHTYINGMRDYPQLVSFSTSGSPFSTVSSSLTIEEMKQIIAKGLGRGNWLAST